MAVPYVIEQTNKGERVYDIYSRLLKDRVIFLGSEIDPYTSNSIIAQLLFLEADNPETDIYFYINSPGGSIQDGLAIYDTLRYIRPNIQTICIGRAFNIAAILLMAGVKGKRSALKNSSIMLHEPFAGIGGQETDIEIQTRQVSKIRASIISIIHTHTGKSLKTVAKDIDREMYFDPLEANAYGIIDKIMTNKQT